MRNRSTAHVGVRKNAAHTAALLARILVCFCVANSAISDTKPLRQIALTFDDAPKGAGALLEGNQRGMVLLDTLASAQTGPVAFFVTTRNLHLPGFRERITRYANAGHLIGNHTHTHPWLRKTEAAEYLAGVDQAEALLSGLSNRRPWFRYPFLDEGRPLQRRQAVYAGLRERGLQNGYVTVDNYDWYLDQRWQQAVKAGQDVDLALLRQAYVSLLLDAVEFYDALAVRTLGRSPAHVLLLHENDVAALFIDDLVQALRTAGFEIISPDEAYKDPIADRQPVTLRTGQGRVAALAVDAGVDPTTLTHRAIDERQIDRWLDELGVFGAKPAREDLQVQ